MVKSEPVRKDGQQSGTVRPRQGQDHAFNASLDYSVRLGLTYFPSLTEKNGQS